MLSLLVLLLVLGSGAGEAERVANKLLSPEASGTAASRKQSRLTANQAEGRRLRIRMLWAWLYAVCMVWN